MADDSSNQASSGGDVFVSYATEDAVVANGVVEALELHELQCWIAPRNVTPGTLYADGIVGAIDGTKVLVLVLSEHAVASTHVRKEIERASSKGRPIIAVRTDSAPLTPAFEYFLSESQWIDVGVAGVDAAAVKLVQAVKRHVEPSAAAEQRVPSAKPVARRATTGLGTRWLAVGGVAILSLVLAYFVVDRFWQSKHVATEQPVAAVVPTVAPAAAISEKSIAVLPFTDMSEKKDQEYLADGMAEEILNQLAQVPDLLVPARTSSFYFKGKPTKIPDIAHELRVVNVLEGSIRRSGDHLRVTAQLVRADTGYHLWSETYDRELDDVFKLQDDIANAVVQALQIKLMGGELSRRKGGTQNLEAYQLYLRARSALYQLTVDAAEKYLDQAIKLDPNYGLAWAGLASNTLVKTVFDMLGPVEGNDRARQLAQHALELSPDLLEARAALVSVFTFNWDWAAAETEAQRALAIDPTNAAALWAAGNVSRTLGRWDDAERQIRAALNRDPLNTFTIGGLAAVYYKTGRYAEAEAMYRKVLELSPGADAIRGAIAYALVQQGKPEAALAMVQEIVDEGGRLYWLPIILQANGPKAEADEALQAEIARWADRGAYGIAMSYAYRGDRDLALQWLERAYQQKDVDLKNIVGEPLFKNLADDPRYKAFLRKMNLPE